jgi:heme o synthase
MASSGIDPSVLIPSGIAARLDSTLELRFHDEPVAQVASDLLTLTKPGVTGLNLVVVLGAYALAGGVFDPTTLSALCLGTLAIVGSAEAMNMVLERETDGLMARTASRPLPRGRLPVETATAFSLALAFLGLPLLALVGWGVAALAAFAWLAYIAVYTPMKRLHPAALLVGAIPGAIPPLMGWAAATGGLDVTAMLLFGVLVAWQMAHFLGIAMYRNDDYRRAGMKTVAVVRGVPVAKRQALAWSIALLASSFGLMATGVVGWLYGVSAGLLGLWMVGMAAAGFRPGAGVPWARRFFLCSVIYLPLLLLVLAIDAVL